MPVFHHEFDLDVDDLADELYQQWEHEHIESLILKLDGNVGDFDFTDRIISKLCNAMLREDPKWKPRVSIPFDTEV